MTSRTFLPHTDTCLEAPPVEKTAVSYEWIVDKIHRSKASPRRLRKFGKNLQNIALKADDNRFIGKNYMAGVEAFDEAGRRSSDRLKKGLIAGTAGVSGAGLGVAIHKSKTAALLDELVKIAEAEQPKKSIGHSLRAMGVAAAGGAVGYGAAELLARKMRFFQQPNEQRARIAKIILPILSGTSVMLADRYRQRLNEEYGKTRGYEGKK